MAPHSSTLAWKIQWTEEPGRLQSMGSLRVRHDWVTSLSLFTSMHWRRKWQPTPVFLPGESQGRGSLVHCRLWGRTESDTTEATYQQQQGFLLVCSDQGRPQVTDSMAKWKHRAIYTPPGNLRWENQRMFSLHESPALWTQNWHGRKNLSWFYSWNSQRSLSKQMPVQWELQNPWGRFKQQAFGTCAPVLTWVSLEQRFNSTAQHNTAMQRTASGVRGWSDSTKDAKQMGTDLFSVWYETWYQTENK